MPILNYTTEVKAERTVQEIQKILVRAGARGILLEYNDDGQPITLGFQLQLASQTLRYKLPCRSQNIYKLLVNHPKVERRHRTQIHAVDVAWRILKNWIEAQLAIIEADLVTMDEVFLPYAITNTGKTFYEHLTDTGYRLEQKESVTHE
jgi:hypothetical protein